MSETEGFAARWSRLKRTEAEPPDAEKTALRAAEAAPEPDPRTDAEILEDLGLPDPEQLQQGDDFTGFLQAGVPAHLRRLALRRLWRLNPTLANLDGLVEYGEDYTDSATVIENLQTAYQVGRGMVKRLVEDEDGDAAADAGPDLEPSEDSETAVTARDADVSPDPAAEQSPDPAAEVDVSTDALAEVADDALAPPRARRMVFKFNE